MGPGPGAYYPDDFQKTSGPSYTMGTKTDVILNHNVDVGPNKYEVKNMFGRKNILSNNKTAPSFSISG